MLKSASNSKFRRGNALLELALVIPMLTLMLVGVMDFARILYTGVTLAGAAHAGADFASQSLTAAGNSAGIAAAVSSDSVDVRSVAATSVQKCFCQATGGGTLTAAGCGASACPSGGPLVYVTVTARTTFKTLVNWPGIPASSLVSQSATVRVR